jgi:hypothetical protein
MASSETSVACDRFGFQALAALYSDRLLVERLRYDSGYRESRSKTNIRNTRGNSQRPHGANPFGTRREAIARHELSKTIAERETLGCKFQRVLDEKTDPWGITVQSVEIRDVRIRNCSKTRCCERLRPTGAAVGFDRTDRAAALRGNHHFGVGDDRSAWIANLSRNSRQPPAD